MHNLTCAHPTLPLGTRLEITNLHNAKQVIVLVNDRGPYFNNRCVDLSREAAKKLGMLRHGIIAVKVKIWRK